jgi:hypothetical protein
VIAHAHRRRRSAAPSRPGSTASSIRTGRRSRVSRGRHGRAEGAHRQHVAGPDLLDPTIEGSTTFRTR